MQVLDERNMKTVENFTGSHIPKAILWQLIKVRLGKAIKRKQELGSDLCDGHLVGLLEAHTSIRVTTCVTDT